MSSRYGGPGGPREGIEMTTSTLPVTLSPDATATVRRAADHTFVRVSGEVDERAATTCRTLVELVVHGGLPVQVDLSGVTFFSAAGITWLVRLYERSEAEVRVVAASEPVRDLLRACDLPMTSRPATSRRRQLSTS